MYSPPCCKSEWQQTLEKTVFKFAIAQKLMLLKVNDTTRICIPKYKHYQTLTQTLCSQTFSKLYYNWYSQSRVEYIITQTNILLYPDDDIAQNEKVALYCPNSSRTVRKLAQNRRAAIALLRAEHGRRTKKANKMHERKSQNILLSQQQRKIKINSLPL